MPAGFTQEECTWFVSPADTNPSGYLMDIDEGYNGYHSRIICQVDSNRIVNSQWLIRGHIPGLSSPSTNHIHYLPTRANYIIIGIKK